MKLWKAAMVAALAFAVAGCGSSGGGGGGSSGGVSSDSAAVATSAAGSTNAGVSNCASGAGGNTGLSVSREEVLAPIQAVLVNHIAARVAEEFEEGGKIGPDKTISVDVTENTLTITFTDEEISEGGGTITLNGNMDLTLDTANQKLTVSGTLSAAMSNVTETVTIDNVSYTETVNGTITTTYSGSFSYTTDNSGALESLTANLSVTVTTDDGLTLAGTANGTVSSMNMTATVTGNALSATSLSLTCSGSVTVTLTDGTSETCNITSDCSGCS